MRDFKLKFHPLGKSIHSQEPLTILEGAKRAGLILVGPCGGHGKCGKCAVRLVRFPKDKNIPPDPESRKLLSETDLNNGYRLACTTKVSDDTEVELPIWSRELSIRSINIYNKLPEDEKLEQFLLELYPFEPLVIQQYCMLPKPTLDDNISDLERIRRCVNKELGIQSDLITFSHETLGTLPQVLRDNDWQVLSVLRARHNFDTVEVMELMPMGTQKEKTKYKTYGMAIDIGSTTIAGYLIELSTGTELTSGSILNPQIMVGSDVISRIRYATQNLDGNKILSQILKEAINSLLYGLASAAQIDQRMIYEITAVGNPTMIMSLFGIPINSLGMAPYIPAFTGDYYAKATEIILQINSAGSIYVGPIVAGYLGADAVGNALVTNLGSSDRNTGNALVKLVLDIGTNGEILLSDGDRLLACSAAAGPAFEGGNLKFGVQACPGAVSKVFIKNNKVKYYTISNQRACGITGSGMIDAISEFVSAGAIQRSGNIDRNTLKYWLKYPKRIKIKSSTAPTSNCELILPELRIVQKNKSALDTTITITQNDIREIQLAKAAIRTGIEILIDELGLTIDDLDEIFLAGAFGNYINPRSAVNINLLPDVELTKIKPIGNAAGTSAKMILRSRKARKQMNELASRIEYLELATHPRFQDLFIKNMEF